MDPLHPHSVQQADGSFPAYLLQENQQDTPENRALFHAALDGNLKDVKAALKRGGKPNFFFRPEDQKNALHVASERGYLDVMEALLEAGAQVNALAAKDHSTPLILAATLPNPAAVKLLLRHGANVHAENGYGNTALHEACYCGHLDTARVLLEEGARIDATNHKGSTPLHMFCYGQNQAQHSVEMAVYLLEHGGEAVINGSDQRGMTPLLVCSSMGRLDLIRLLLARGANRHARDASQRSAEQIARFYQHAETAAFFAGEGGEGKHHK